MKIHKVIARIDYRTAHDILDRPGSLLKLLETSVPESFWSELAESRDLKQLIGFQKNRPGEWYQFAVRHEDAFLEFESLSGIEPKNLYGSEVIKTTIALLEEIMAEFKIKHIDRIGFRCTYFGHSGAAEVVTNKFRESISAAYLAAIDTGLGGRIQDYGLNFDGGSDDGIQYHLNMGPSNISEITKYLKRVPVNNADLPIDLVMDLDVYERKLGSQLLNVKNWIGDAISKSQDVASKIENAIYDNKDE